MTLADFLLAQTPSIVALFTRRLQTTLAPGASPGDLVSHVPDLLRDVGRALCEGDEPASRLLSSAPEVHQHWWRRFGVGYDLGTLVREFRLLRDCIFERLEDMNVQPTLREHRTLDICLSDMLVGSVDAFANERDALLAREKQARAEAEAGRQQAEEASRIKNEFLATVSHELRTPLTSMLGWVQMLRTGSLASDRSDHALAVIDRNAHAQAQLIDDLLDMSRILAGKLRLEVEPLDVQSAVLAAIETIRPTADTKGIRILPVLSSCGLVMGDPHRLQQVIWNLLSNAVKFTPRGGRVQVTVECLHSSVEISVADTGKGIPADFLPHVFDRFRQADGGMSRRFGGLGLGLSIVRQLVELHGGTVSVESEGEARGSRFTVKLPLSVAVRDLDAPSSLQHSLRGHGVQCPPELTGLRLLVIDDEHDTRELLQVMLEGCGAAVRSASSAAEGLALCIDEPPDVLVSDIGMPEENGYSLIEKIRALPPGQGGDVPAIALTAYARTEDRTRALLAGFSNHVAKPVEPLELLAVIASLARRVRG